MWRLDHFDRRVRFLFAGGSAAGLSWVARFVFSAAMPYSAAVAAATATGMIFGFFAYRSLVFPDSRRTLFAQLCGFLVVNLIGGAVTVAVATFTCDLVLLPLGFPAAAPASHAIGIAVGAVANYLGHKTITFNTA
ncbi:sugar translocase [Methylobacterium fujisawaense]|jgi:putative flippase GtrA|uniref:GtrA family protein n=1 Tax=Methylobacterium fujisawaense TaxID=107400 RepID=UPI002F2DB035